MSSLPSDLHLSLLIQRQTRAVTAAELALLQPSALAVAADAPMEDPKPEVESKQEQLPSAAVAEESAAAVAQELQPSHPPAPASAPAAAAASSTLSQAPSASILFSLRPRGPHRRLYADPGSSGDEDEQISVGGASFQVQPKRFASGPRTRSSSADSSHSSNKKQSSKPGGSKASRRASAAATNSLSAAELQAKPSTRSQAHRGPDSRGSSEEAKEAPREQHQGRLRKRAKHDPQPAIPQPTPIAAAAARAHPPVRQSERTKPKDHTLLPSSSTPSSAAASSADSSIVSKASRLRTTAAAVASSTDAASSSTAHKPKDDGRAASASLKPKKGVQAPAAASMGLGGPSAPRPPKHARGWKCPRCKQDEKCADPHVDSKLDACPRCGQTRSDESKRRGIAAIAASARKAEEKRGLSSAAHASAAAAAPIQPMSVAGKLAFALSPEPASASTTATAPPNFPSWLPRAICIPDGWTLDVTDLCIVGGGAAGLQCAEHISRLAKTSALLDIDLPAAEPVPAAAASASSSSAVASPAASALAAPPPVDIRIVEARNRTGGRIDTVPWRTHGREIAVERGAAYVHGFGDENLAAGVAVRYNLDRRPKHDSIESWFEGGEQLPDWLVVFLREVIHMINARIKTQAHQLAQRMTGHTEGEKKRRAADAADPAAAPAATAASVAASLDNWWLNRLDRQSQAASVVRGSAADNEERKEHQGAAASSIPAPAEIVDLTMDESSSESESSGTDSSSDDSDTDGSSSASEEDAGSSDGQRVVSGVPRMLPPAPLPRSDGPAAMELNSPSPSAAFVLASSGASHDGSAASVASIGAGSVPSEELHSPMLANPVLSSPATRKRRHISDASIANSEESKQASDGAANEAAISALLREDAASLSRRLTRASRRPQAASSPIAKRAVRSHSVLDYATIAPTLKRMIKQAAAPHAKKRSGPRITAYVPELDCSVQQLFDEALNELMNDPVCAATLTPHLQSILYHMQCIIAGYICPLSQLSAFDMTKASANDGGDRSLLGGYVTVLDALLARLKRRRKRGQCGFRVLKEHTVNCIELVEHTIQAVGQPPESSSSAAAAAVSASPSVPSSYALIYCPNQRVIVAARFVVVTASIGILQSSLKYESQLAQRHFHLLQPEAQRRRGAVKTVPQARSHSARATSTDVATSAAASAASRSEKSELAAAAAAAGASALAPHPAYPPAFPFAPAPDIPGPHIYQLEAGILFEPPLSPLVREAIEKRGMGLENKILLQFPEGSRFWPTHHLLHSANYPMYRFYNLDGIRGEPCDILVAHVPPPYAQELENLPLEEVQRRIMIVLHDMFTTRRNGGTARTRQYAESSENFIDSHSGDEIGSEIEISASSGDEADQNDRAVARQRKCAEIRASKKLRKESPTKQEDHSLARAAALRADKDWKKKPVVLPMRIEVTKWGQDPFAQGAYSCIPIGCSLSMIYRLQQPEPLLSSSGRSGVLYFAGEATDAQDNQQVHGAMESGVRAAEQIWKRMQGSSEGHADGAAAAVAAGDAADPRAAGAAAAGVNRDGSRA